MYWQAMRNTAGSRAHPGIQEARKHSSFTEVITEERGGRRARGWKPPGRACVQNEGPRASASLQTSTVATVTWCPSEAAQYPQGEAKQHHEAGPFRC